MVSHADMTGNRAEARIAAIGEDTTSGASRLTAEAVRALAAAAAGDLPGDGWADEVRVVADRIGSAKPSMAGVRNAPLELSARLTVLGPEEGRRRASAMAEELVSELRLASQQAVVNAVDALLATRVVATCSHSSAVVRVCRGIVGRKGSLLVLAYEDGGGYGQKLVEELEDRGIDARTVDRPPIDRCDAVLLGADSVTPHVVVNGSPSLELAEAAYGRAPVHVVCETVKLVDRVPAEAGYDRVPLGLVDSVITEDGAMGQSEIERHVRC